MKGTAEDEAPLGHEQQTRAAWWQDAMVSIHQTRHQPRSNRTSKMTTSANTG